MKKVTMFHFEGCPYCAQARGWLGELLSERPEFKALEIELIDEKLHPEIAERFGYWYVPTLYVGDEKAHEGAATKEKLRRVLELALGD